MSAVETNLENGIFEITLNRPKQLNALNWEMITQLNEIADEIEQNSNVRCVVLKGRGDHFMAGGDIMFFHELLDMDDEIKTNEFNTLISSVHDFIEKMAKLPVPVVASIRGAAAGFGISLVAGSDLAIASNKSFYTSAYNLLGTSPDGGSTYYLPRTLSTKKAMEIVLLTKRYSSDEALEMGLVNQVVNDSELDGETAAVAQTIARSAKVAVRNAKQLIRQSFQHDLNSQLKSELDNFLKCVATDDFSEGIRAFVQKRKPDFQ